MKNWSDFDRFDAVIEKYMPRMGQGETKASQVCTAVNKLVYKWFNDGDVYDNTYYLEGWCNDLSDYANWLDRYTDFGDILRRIATCDDEDDYTDLLYDLCVAALDEGYLEALNMFQKKGDIYNCTGVFRFVEDHDDEEEEEW